LLHEAAEILRRGGLVIVPTETFYGIAADPFQEAAVRRIFLLKGRELTKPLPLIASDREVVDSVIQPAAGKVLELMDRYWPGSLTILLAPVVAFGPMLSGPEGKIGVRVPPPCPARALARLAGGLITATSANLSGDPEADEISKISPRLRALVDLVIDLGRTPGGKPSTLVAPTADGVKIIRQGAVSLNGALETRGASDRC
jgi:L-threonylcarbamoyladenylate synthase